MPRQRPRAHRRAGARALALVVLAGVGVAGCGGGSGNAGSTTTSTSAATTTTLPTATAPVSDDTGSAAIASSGSASLTTAPEVAPVLKPIPAPGPPLHVPLGADGQAPPAIWPDACSLLTESQLLAIVPAATSVTHQGRAGRRFGDQLTPHATSCTWRLTWAAGAAAPGTVTVDLRAVASANVLASVASDRRSAAQERAKSDPGLFADYATLLGGASCFFDGAALECVAGSFSFSVSGADPRPAPPSALQRSQAWRNHVLAKVVVLLVERMAPDLAAASNP